MNLKKIVVSSVTALTLASVGAMAADNANTTLATDGTGDYLVFPYYAATGAWETHLRVVNTNTKDAVVAKVVFREYKQSAEVLDFPIYLTPGDVWEGTVTIKDGKVVVKSSDDSLVLADYPQLDKTLAMNPNRGGKNPAFGYVEVFGVAQIPAVDVDPTFKEKYPLDKEKLVKKFKAELNGHTYTGNEWTGVDANSLYAEEILYENNQKLAMTLPATALEGVTGTSANDKKITGVDTQIADMIKDRNPMPVLLQMKSALSKQDIYANFYDYADDTVLLLTQPLAKYVYNTDHVVEAGFFYHSLARDTQENSNVQERQETDISGQDLPPAKKEGCWYTDDDYAVTPHGHEICFIDVKKKAGGFENGYVDFTIEDEGGRAIIPVLMSVKKVSGTNVTNVVYTPYKK